MGNDLNNLLALVRAAEAIATALNNYGIGEREFADMREAAFEQGLEEIPDVMINAKIDDAQSAIDKIGVNDNVS